MIPKALLLFSSCFPICLLELSIFIIKIHAKSFHQVDLMENKYKKQLVEMKYARQMGYCLFTKSGITIQ